MTSLTTSPVSDTAQLKVFQRIAKELGVGPPQVTAAVTLLDEGPRYPSLRGIAKKPPTISTIPICVLGRTAALSAGTGRAAHGDPGVD